ncbi:hypothetical protein ACH5RR_030605 [Cinchona calisaya]|uniref:RNase H type-1 domain-containing protein n=1 Tax=Cinchona calisaya TaxID=153742 RepID=A0ABD2YWF5_9GENT
MGLGYEAAESMDHGRKRHDEQINKLEAIRLALIKALDTRWKDIIVENHDKEIIESLKKRKGIHGKFEILTEDILELSLLFQNCSPCVLRVKIV